jgi:predicted ATPase/DNA-binding CsgD family transcriptional regulator
MKDEGNPYLLDPLTNRELEILSLISKGCSNQEIAQELFLTHGTIKWYNRQIFSKLGVKSRTKAAAKAEELNLLAEESRKPTRQAISPKHNLPAPITSFIGRMQAINELKQLLSVSRMVTLLGPGGVGKTRLALQVGEQVLDWFEDGVWFADLAPLRDPSLLINTIINTLNLHITPDRSPKEILKKHLRDKHILLILDNFEQIIEAGSLIGELLISSPYIKVLVTSRETLQIYGEEQYQVPPLSLPSEDRQHSVQEIVKYESVELFCQRAISVIRDFEVTKKNVNTVAEICSRLDGLPLAIELAAARCKILTPEMILTRLQNRLDALSIGSRDVPTRLQSLRGTLEWSYDLLEPEEKTLFARLSVFQGGRSIEALENICSSGLNTDILDGIESLLNKNLIFQEQGEAGETRFYFLETLHEFAFEKLKEMSEIETLHKRHSQYFTELAERAEYHLYGGRQTYWTSRLRDDLDNLRVALKWTLMDNDIELGVRLISALREFWYSEGYITEGFSWIEVALEREKEIPKAIKPGLFNAAGLLSFAKGDLEVCKAYHLQALELARELDNAKDLAWSLIFLAGAFMDFPETVKEGIALCVEGIALFKDMDFKPGILRGLNIQGEIFRMTGNYKQAEITYRQCLDLCRLTGNKQREAFMIGNLGSIAMQQGDFKKAKKLQLEAFVQWVEPQNSHFVRAALAFVAGPFAALGQPERAARLLGASEALLESLGISYQPLDQKDIDGYIACAREQLDEKTFARVWQEGRLMTEEQAIAYAIGEETKLASK